MKKIILLGSILLFPLLSFSETDISLKNYFRFNLNPFADAKSTKSFSQPVASGVKRNCGCTISDLKK